MYNLTIGAHLANENDWIGHAFVSIEFPRGKIETKGFWPKNGFDLRRKGDKAAVLSGMEGVVLDDSEYLNMTSGINKKRDFSVSEPSAGASNGVVQKYVDNPPTYHLIYCQCATFALEVINAAGENVEAGDPPRPSVLIEHL